MENNFSSSSYESTISHMASPDICIFGPPEDFSGLNLPSKRDVLKYYFFLGYQAKKEGKKCAYKNFTADVLNKLTEIWNRLFIDLMNEKSILLKLNQFIEKYQREIKSKSKLNRFVESIDDLFFIGKCKCNLKVHECKCGEIPKRLTFFMLDQHNDRKLTIPENHSDQVSTIATFLPVSHDSTYQPSQLNMEVEELIELSAPSEDVLISPKPRAYTKRYSALNFAMMCDRFGISDRVASGLATALFKDIDYRDETGDLIIMDKNKVAREKMKGREAVRKSQAGDTNLCYFSFDGRKDDALTMEKIDGKYHQSMVKEAHLVVLKEPNSKLLGYVTVQAEDALTKQRQLSEFFSKKGFSFNNLIGICSDGENTNTGVSNGIIRRFEIALGRPLHWFICLLHFNELPFRHLFEFLDNSKTSGPRTASGLISKQITCCEKMVGK